ncbi:ATP-binding cassette domain-containing protein [Chromobacterium haemolyticum]|uniref:ATP-binding cassette domain-containing protein n=1 Tax=Chromobacterium haemolyticum TaxID=394935 RepID=A0ABS3GNT7_9NEIS|nr:ATP-binding cassette domain-containing protein [Chromobacterium haemolyticum]MBK0415335.1 ATP-binding cassette domain-containing protein [Chromobacterium haemolyticum]MBO0416716.1 ATP-binding cassette domain-containing protein [Chromobacterium haemolyticum]MBO0500096.1 ATP-binding cassette domain-containing protein [Chromobacterium haemolyticum]
MSLEFHDAGLKLDGAVILRGITLRLAAGEQAALIGPSGAGKSSLLLLANTGLRPDAGEVRLLGANPWRLPRRALRALRARIGSVYQTPPLPPRQRVIHAVAAGRLGHSGELAALLRLLWPDDAAGVAAELERLGLSDKLWQRCDQLSGGQRQRVGIARALYQRPELLLADEPVSALDPRLADDTIRLLCEDARARRAALLVSLHSVQLALEHFPRIIGLRDGAIAFDLPREQVDSALLTELYSGDSPDAAMEAAAPATALRGLQC